MRNIIFWTRVPPHRGIGAVKVSLFLHGIYTRESLFPECAGECWWSGFWLSENFGKLKYGMYQGYGAATINSLRAESTVSYLKLLIRCLLIWVFLFDLVLSNLLGARPYDFTSARLDFCNWGEISASSLSVPKIEERGRGWREGRDRDDEKKTPLVVLTRRKNEMRISLRANKKRLFFRRQPIWFHRRTIRILQLGKHFGFISVCPLWQYTH